MNVILVRIPEGLGVSRAWLREGQSATVGRSELSDLCLEDDLQLAEVHFQVEVRPEGCCVRNLAGENGSLLVNGSPVFEAVLRDQDVIQAGQSLFRVVIEGLAGGDAVPVGDAPGEGLTQETLRVSRRALPTAVEALRVIGAREHLLPVTRTLAAERTASLLANLKRPGLPLPQGVAAEEDLFQHAPPEIRAGDSLHLMTADELPEAVELATSLAGEDAGMLVITSVPREEFAAGHKLYWAWFARPSLLMFQLNNGSAELAGKLLQDIYAVLIALPADEDLLIYCHPEDTAAIQAALSAMEVPMHSA